MESSYTVSYTRRQLYQRYQTTGRRGSRHFRKTGKNRSAVQRRRGGGCGAGAVAASPALRGYSLPATFATNLATLVASTPVRMFAGITPWPRHASSDLLLALGRQP
jgi:hypothetical protein